MISKLSNYLSSFLEWLVGIHKFRSPLKLVAFYLLFTFITATIGILLGLAGSYNDPSRWFREGRLMTWISFYFLILCGAYAREIWRIRGQGQRLQIKDGSAVWWLCFSGFIFLALDEMCRLHEAIDRYSHKLLGIVETPLTDRFDDLIVLGYGLIGLGVLFYYRRELYGFVRAAPYFLVGFLGFFAMAFIDFAFHGNDFISLFVSNKEDIRLSIGWISAIEDMFKLGSEVLFLGGFAACFAIGSKLKIADEQQPTEQREVSLNEHGVHGLGVKS